MRQQLEEMLQDEENQVQRVDEEDSTMGWMA
jgi:hypothetical protein